MNKVLDDGLVILLLLASVAYALSSLGPKGLRRRLWSALARAAARAPAGWHMAGLARRLDQAAADKSASACGGCDNCGDGGENSEGGDSEGGEQTNTTSEIRVPLAKIGRRRQLTRR